MLARIRRRLAARCKPATVKSQTSDSAPLATTSQLDLVREQLVAAALAGSALKLRDLHRVTGLPQSVALRAFRALEERGEVVRRECLHDPLASEIGLK